MDDNEAGKMDNNDSLIAAVYFSRQLAKNRKVNEQRCILFFFCPAWKATVKKIFRARVSFRVIINE